MNLHICELEPGAASRLQLGRLGNFREPEHVAVEGEARRFQRARHSDLHVIDCRLRRGTSQEPAARCRSLASMGAGC